MDPLIEIRALLERHGREGTWAAPIPGLTLFLAGGLFAVFYIPTLVEGGWSAALKLAAEGGKTEWLNTRFTFSAPFNIWMGIIGGTVMVLSTHGAEQLIVQRVLACRTVADGRKALTLSAVLIFPLMLTFLMVGVLLWVFYQSHPFQIPRPEGRPGIKSNDFVFPIFMMTEVPHILKGFLIVAILSAAMSSISSAITSLASVSTMDFVKEMVGWGAGPRAGISLISAAKAHAVLRGRFHATTSDVAAVATPVLRHRVLTTFNAEAAGVTSDDVVKRLIKVLAPREELVV